MLQINEPIRDIGPLLALTNNPIYRRYDVMAESKITKTTRICQVEGCTNTVRARGFCNKHYERIRLSEGFNPLYAKICKIDDCNNKPIARGLCKKHYSRIRSSIGFPCQKVCSAEGCESPAISKGYCVRHYSQIKNKGRIIGSPKYTQYTPNDIISNGETSKVILRDAYGKHIGEAKIDSEDIDKISEMKWCLNGEYASSCGKLLHRVILSVENESKKVQVDHINHDTLDCRKENLRLCNNAQNQWNRKLCTRNSSGYKGVSYSKKDKIWMSRIRKNNKEIYIGSFANKIDAAIAYDNAAIKMFGEFANTNGLI